MSPLEISLLLATLAGATIPIGAIIAQVERIQPRWLEAEFRHTMIAFGGGVLLAAVSLVLVPEGIRPLTWPWIASHSEVAGWLSSYSTARSNDKGVLPLS